MNLEPVETGERPNAYPGSAGKCMYCKSPLGEPHTENCVVPQRSVVVKITVHYVVSVPRCFTSEEIESHRNDGSFCLGNDIEQIFEETEAVEGQCNICQRAAMKFVREATAEDHGHYAFGQKRATPLEGRP